MACLWVRPDGGHRADPGKELWERFDAALEAFARDEPSEVDIAVLVGIAAVQRPTTGDVRARADGYQNSLKLRSDSVAATGIERMTPRMAPPIIEPTNPINPYLTLRLKKPAISGINPRTRPMPAHPPVSTAGCCLRGR